MIVYQQQQSALALQTEKKSVSTTRVIHTLCVCIVPRLIKKLCGTQREREQQQIVRIMVLSLYIYAV